MEHKDIKKKLYTGQVVSDKMDKTIVVKVVRTFEHPQFEKILRKVKKFQVHDEQGLASEGDIVEFFEGRPASKNKCMYLSRIIQSSSTKK